MKVQGDSFTSLVLNNIGSSDFVTCSTVYVETCVSFVARVNMSTSNIKDNFTTFYKSSGFSFFLSNIDSKLDISRHFKLDSLQQLRSLIATELHIIPT